MAAPKSIHNISQMASKPAVFALVLLCAALAQAEHWETYQVVDSNQAASTYDIPLEEGDKMYYILSSTTTRYDPRN